MLNRVLEGEISGLESKVLCLLKTTDLNIPSSNAYGDFGEHRSKHPPKDTASLFNSVKLIIVITYGVVRWVSVDIREALILLFRDVLFILR